MSPEERLEDMAYEDIKDQMMEGFAKRDAENLALRKRVLRLEAVIRTQKNLEAAIFAYGLAEFQWGHATALYNPETDTTKACARAREDRMAEIATLLTLRSTP